MTDIKHRYRGLYAEHGPSLKSLAWSGIDAQLKRFNVMRDYYNKPGTVLDAGCGFGDFSIMFSSHEYTGVDIVPEFIDEARRKYPTKIFHVGDIKEIDEQYDYVFASGILSFQDLPINIVEHLWRLTRKRLIFNWHNANPRDIDLVITINSCDSYQIRHDYLPHDTTVCMNRDFQ
jgi:SAM-dependent methyltransferase